MNRREDIFHARDQHVACGVLRGTGDRAEVFAEGWLNAKCAYDGRPVDVAQLPDGSLIVSDDYAGAVYRITYEGDEGAMLPN